MRVIAGSARRLLLSTLPGEDTRPTTDRIKETLFNMLQPEVPGSRFLISSAAAAELPSKPCPAEQVRRSSSKRI